MGDKDYLGVAEITTINNTPHFNAALIVGRRDFADIRDLLVRNVGKLQVKLEDAGYKKPFELAKSGEIVQLVAASVAGEYAITKQKIRG
ncbi:MAG TPA: hypothetical protein VN685_11460 [Rhizomicrobium sp.]|nr:hypothetical protein [Rhizomicrobium sp.]